MSKDKESSFFLHARAHKQWVPSWIRFPVKCLALPFVLIDHLMQKVANQIVRPPFKRRGACKKRGKCCEVILISHATSLLGRLFYFWYTQFLGFYRKEPEPEVYEGRSMYVMGCRHLKEDGTCGDYFFRPLICRNWPVVEHFGFPKILKGCGYFSDPPYPAETANALSEGTDPRLKILH